ncbi:MAG UNVERIFIED_CONTAM: hypothetical protein LVR18_52420 [Planctomycetaceae bacterium]|jgi:hypothetical protein
MAEPFQWVIEALCGKGEQFTQRQTLPIWIGDSQQLSEQDHPWVIPSRQT